MRIQSGLILLVACTLLGPLSWGETKPAGKTHTVLIKGFRFAPERLEVAPGDTVVWKNEDIVPHTATAKKGFDSKNLDKGQSWSWTAKTKGTYPYICTYHPTMVGELVVK